MFGEPTHHVGLYNQNTPGSPTTSAVVAPSTPATLPVALFAPVDFAHTVPDRSPCEALRFFGRARLCYN